MPTGKSKPVSFALLLSEAVVDMGEFACKCKGNWTATKRNWRASERRSAFTGVELGHRDISLRGASDCNHCPAA